jgi:hypothetical protein
VVSATDPYGRILGFLDRNLPLQELKFHPSAGQLLAGLHTDCAIGAPNILQVIMGIEIIPAASNSVCTVSCPSMFGLVKSREGK